MCHAYVALVFLLKCLQASRSKSACATSQVSMHLPAFIQRGNTTPGHYIGDCYRLEQPLCLSQIIFSLPHTQKVGLLNSILISTKRLQVCLATKLGGIQYLPVILYRREVPYGTVQYHRREVPYYIIPIPCEPTLPDTGPCTDLLLMSTPTSPVI